MDKLKKLEMVQQRLDNQLFTIIQEQGRVIGVLAKKIKRLENWVIKHCTDYEAHETKVDMPEIG